MDTAGRATLVATLASRETLERDLAALPTAVESVELRADLVGEVEASWLRERFRGALLFTLRSAAEGGRFQGSPGERAALLRRAAQRFDFIDLEGDRDDDPELLAALPAERRIVSWHGEAADLQELRARHDALRRIEARFYKIVTASASSGHELRPLALLKSLNRTDVIAFAMGPIGGWTRLLAPRLGAAVVYCSAGETAGAPGQLSARALVEDFGLPELPPAAVLCGVAGNPVAHSLSPRLHNAAYRALGLPRLYVPFHVESFGDFWLEIVESGSLDVLGFPLRGLSVTAPFKEAALAMAGASSPLAERVQSANTLLFHDGVWEAETTDPEGVVQALRARGIVVRGRRAAVVGAGGAGRAAAAGLKAEGAEVTLVNRSSSRGRDAAGRLRLEFLELSRFDPAAFGILVHATSLGRLGEAPPFAIDRLAPGSTLVDLVYGESPTPLVAAARARGVNAADGREVLLWQAAAQFRMMTGRELPLDVALRVLGLEGPR